MKNIPFIIKDFGPEALLLEWPNRVDAEILAGIIGFSEYLRENFLDDIFWEMIPIYNSITLINRQNPESLLFLKENLNSWYNAYLGMAESNSVSWELPVCYDPDFGLDLEEASAYLKCSPKELIDLHGRYSYRVFGLGFLPGFLYLGGVPDILRIPRRTTPRLKVPKGAVGLAEFQTGIYPQNSPGGWNIIGNCPIPIFNVNQDPPCLIKAGDTVQFFAISHAEYELYRLEAEVGVYNIRKRFSDDNG